MKRQTSGRGARRHVLIRSSVWALISSLLAKAKLSCCLSRHSVVLCASTRHFTDAIDHRCSGPPTFLSAECSASKASRVRTTY